ncbi:MAG: hypothetical protein Ct9H300mP25_07860 [Acidobacteriota bacterium]|nr:MAG: hypothetical protein Ct9H300mP25_07860 [Acidobacteriota bacterium]
MRTGISRAPSRTIILRDDPARAATVTLTKDGSPTQLLFNPYTGADLGHRLPLPYRLTTWLLDLHDNLLYGETGRRINGLGAIVLCSSQAPVLYLVARFAHMETQSAC